MSRKIRVGIIGANFGAKVHSQAFRRDARAEVVALAANHLKTASSAAREWKVPYAYAGWQNLLKHPGLDAVSIAVPPKYQPAIAMAALRRKISVLAEKPLALSLAEAGALAAAARKSGVAHMIDYEFSHIPSWIAAKKLLADGSIGALRHVSIAWRVETYANRFKTLSWKTRSTEGGGALAAFGCHTLHAMEWFAGPIHRLSAKLDRARDLPSKGDTLCSLRAEFKSGVTGLAEICTHAFPSTGHEFRFFGEKGALHLVNRGQDYVRGFELYKADRKNPEFARVRPEKEFNFCEDGRVEAVSALVRDFLNWVECGKSGKPDFTDALRVEKLLHAARLSAKKNTVLLKVA